MRGWQRLRSDYALGILTSFGACAVVGILPFAVYRFATGNTPAAILDAVIVDCVCLAVAQAWRHGDRVRPDRLRVRVAQRAPARRVAETRDA